MTDVSIVSGIDRSSAIRIHAFNAIFWAAVFLLHTVQMLLAGMNDDTRALAWRAAMSVFCFGLSVPLGWTVAHTLTWRPLRRLPLIAAVCLVAAVIFALVGHYVWYVLLMPGTNPYSLLVGLIIQTLYNLVLFLMWAGICAAILYARQLRERERSLLEARALAHEAELKMLRYQINPHFLFNTLNAVSALVVTGQSREADAMIGKLARFFRNALSRESNAKVTLAEETRVQAEYLEIELTRFAERVSFSTHIDPGLDQALVPHLILQPLIENAIKHGVTRNVDPVAIRVAATRANATLLLTVENDVTADVRTPLRAGAGVGLANVARRLTSFYGAEGTLSAARREGRFVVELGMPLELTL